MEPPVSLEPKGFGRGPNPSRNVSGGPHAVKQFAAIRR